MKTLKASDIPAGAEATAYIEIDGKIEEFFYAKSIEASSYFFIKITYTQNKP